MAYRYAVRKSSYARYAWLAAGGVVFFPLSLTRVDFRQSFGRTHVSAHHASPAFAALEDLSLDLGRSLDLAKRDLPALDQGRSVDPREFGGPRQRQVALRGMTIRRPEVLKPEPAVMVASARPSTVGGIAARLVRRELASAGEAAPTGAATEVTDFRPALDPVVDAAQAGRPTWIDGQIEMTGGLGWIGPETDLVVRRTLDGRTLENGRIWITEGKFEIHVGQPTGYLVAELKTRDGRVLGRGEVNLAGLSRATPRIGDLKIALRPTTEVASLRTISAYSHDERKLAINDARVEIESIAQPSSVDDEGFVSEPSLGAGSTYLARASAAKHWPSLVVAGADQPRDVRLLPNQMVRALLDLSLKRGDRREAGERALVWGQVTSDGKPVANAQVEVTAGVEPIYFNEAFLPDPALSRTGTNGLFAVVNVKPGVQAVRVRRGEVAYPAHVFATEARHVSYVEMTLRDDVIAEFHVSDVHQGNRVTPARLRLVGTDAELATGGQAVVKLNTAGDLMMVEADAGPDFEVTRVTAGAEPRRIELPVVRREWLRGLYGRSGVEPRLDRGAVVGFVDGQDFEVEMSGGLLKERLPIVYFDAAGRPLEGTTGSAGGGFAILNAPTGLQTVQIHPTGSRVGFAQVVVAEPNLVHAVTWSPPAAR